MNHFSKIGFIIAALGSSIGLGHIWRFPYIAGTNGGGMFVLLYLFLALSLGVAMLIGEMLLGNKGRANALQCYETLAPKRHKKWRYAGLSIIGGPIILSFYAIVLGWVLYYLFMISVNLPTDIESSKAIFTHLYNANPIAQICCFLCVMAISGFIVSLGIKKGIELLNLILIPLLFLIFLGLLLYAMSMDSFSRALYFMFHFDVAEIKKALSPHVFIDSLGQVFFSLSLGVGTMMTYAASSPPHQNLIKSAFYIVISGVVIAMMAGMMIFTFVYEYNGTPSSGAGLIFETLPVMFSHLGIIGNVIAFLFLSAFSFAGITSAISLLEPTVMYMRERFAMNRIKATLCVSTAVSALGILIICSLYVPFQHIFHFTFYEKSFSLMSMIEFFATNIIMTLGGFLCVIFVGYIIPKRRLYALCADFFTLKLFVLWYGIIRYIAPFIILIILIAECADFFT